MPTVPQYNRQVQEAPIPSVRVQANTNTGSYGAGVGQALGGLGAEIEKRAAVLQQEKDTKDVLDISNKFDADNLAFFHDKDNGLFSKKMDAASGSYGKAEKYFGEKTKEYIAMAKNDTQKNALLQFINGRQQAYLKNSALFEAEQFQASRAATTEAAVNNGIQGIAANYNNTEGINSHLAVMKQSVISGNVGAPQDAINQMVLGAQTKGISAAIGRALNEKNSALARKLYDQYEPLIAPTVKGELTKAIADGEIKTQVADSVSYLKNKYTLEDGTINLEGALGETDKIEDVDLRDKTRTGILQVSSDENAIKHQKDNRNFDAFYKNLTASGAITQAQVREMADNSGLNGKDYISALSVGNQWIGLENVITTPDVWKQVHDNVLSGNIKDSTQLWRDYGDKMSFSDLKSFTSMLDSIDRKEAGTPKELSMPGIRQAIGMIAKDANVKPEDYGSMYEKIASEIKAFKAKTGDITAADIETITKQQVASTIIKRRLPGADTFGKSVPLFKVPTGAERDPDKGQYYLMDDNGEQLFINSDDNGETWYTIFNNQKYMMSK